MPNAGDNKNEELAFQTIAGSLRQKEMFSSNLIKLFSTGFDNSMFKDC